MPEGTDASKWAFHGSTIVMVAESREECKEILSKDIYATSGVWDIDNAQIWPVSLQLRKASQGRAKIHADHRVLGKTCL